MNSSLRLIPFVIAALLADVLPTSSASARTKMYCVVTDQDSGRYAAKSRPRACAVFGPGDAFAGGVNLTKLRWRNWGASTAHATGVSLGFRADPVRLRATVKLTGLRNGRCGRTYGQLRATTKHGSWVVPLTRCPRPA